MARHNAIDCAARRYHRSRTDHIEAKIRYPALHHGKALHDPYIGDSSWSPDDKQVAFVTNITGRNNIWLVSAQSGWPTQLTVSNQRQANIAWSPKGRWIAYNSDYDGNEQWDLFLVSVSNGQVVNLTNTPEVSEEGAAWSPDGEKLAYSVKPKQSPNYEIDVIEILTKK